MERRVSCPHTPSRLAPAAARRHHPSRGRRPDDGRGADRSGRRGDAGAFDLLYRRYARPVFALALRRLGDRGRAEDAVQETFASVWRSARSYRQDRGPGAPWLYAVARNAIVDRRRALGEPTAEPVDEAAKDPGLRTRQASWTAWRVHRALGCPTTSGS